MADKSFGVKELNLLNASGTPTVTSPNNLNLNANTVAISTSCTIGSNLTVSGDIDVDGHTELDNVNIAGVVTATTFSGSGASLTNLPAANLTGTLPAISGANLTNLPATDPTNSDIQVVYTVTANGSSAYRFAGNGVVSTADNPDLHLIRGQKYRFVNNSGGSHPFQIRVSSGGSAYSTGVTNNGASSGNIDFAPTYDSPAQLVYQCTSHGGMVGNIYIQGAGGGRGILTQNTSLTGSSMTFDGLPSWATKITVNLLESSLSGTDQTYVRLRSGTGADLASITSDYSCVSGNFQGNITSSKTDAFNINTSNATQLLSGSMVIEKIDSAGLKYIQSHMFLCTNNNSRHGGGNLERSSGTAIVGVELTSEGSNTFDGGVVTIYYE